MQPSDETRLALLEAFLLDLREELKALSNKQDDFLKKLEEKYITKEQFEAEMRARDHERSLHSKILYSGLGVALAALVTALINLVIKS
jgi:hypothetical protein